MLVYGALAQAAPTGGVVTAGQAQIGGTLGQMTVTQTTPHAAIHWQSFGIRAGESVRFVQPSSASVTLNRVIGADPSGIMGNLSANGKVFLVNPNGILFGPGATVNVGSLVASTLGISDADFMAGRYRFSGAGSGAGLVVNQGLIQTSEGGYVALLGHQVSNQGRVEAQLGTVALAAGQAMTLDVSGDQLLHVAIDQGVAKALLSNGGLLQADGGKVLMTTQVAGNLLANAVNNTGVVQARSLAHRNGSIYLLGSMDTGTVTVGGKLDVNGGQGQTGGRVVATAHQVGLFNAQIQASGDAGGGVVLVGGDYQGQNPAVPHAAAVYMSADSAIQADARVQGDGGKIVLWSDGATRAHGQVSARGGEQGGHGGLLETSGHWLNVAGLGVDTRAAKGRTGTWLLDPADVTISSAATSDAVATGGVYAPNSGVTSANVNVADLVTALGGTNVSVTTTNTGVSGAGLGDIHVNAAITWIAPTTLTLTAARDVNVNQAITGTGGSLAVHAGQDITVGAAVTTTTGSLGFTAVQDVNLNAATTITTGHLTAVGGRHVNAAAVATVTTGNIVFRADNDGTGPGAPGGTVSITCGPNCLTVTTGALRIRFNPVSYASTNSEILAYSGKLTGGGTLDAKAWVFGLGNNKTYDGTTAASVSGLMPDLTAVAPPVSLGSITNANFDTRHVGTNKPITFDTTFADAAYDLFATSTMPAGTHQARANVLVRPLSVTAATDTRAYNGTTSSVGIPTATGLQAGDTLNGALTQVFASKDALGTGNSTLTANGANTVSDGNGGSNYAVSFFTAPGTITPAPLTVTALDVSKVYGQAPSLTGFSTTALVNGETVGSVTLSSSGQPATAAVAGSPYAITPSSAAGGTFAPGNYSIAYVNGALSITPAPLTVTALDVSKVYGQAPSLTGFSTTALVNGETVGSVALSSSGQPATAAVAGSPYAITPSSAAGGTFAPGNYSIAYVNGALSITPAPLTVTALDVSKVYGQAPALTGFSTTALVNGETVGSVALSSSGQPATAAVAGSPYAITPSNAAGGTFVPGNYSIAYVNGALSITPAPLTVTALDVSKVYGQAPALTGFSTTGLVNGETVGSVALSSSGQPATAAVAGSPYAITPSSAAGGTFVPGNYSIAYVNGTLNVIPPVIVPPVEPPVLPPVEPPVLPPVEPPVLPPVEPPVLPPVEPPVLPPVEPPVLPPVEPPVLPPVEPPIIPSADLPKPNSEQAIPTLPVVDPKPAWFTIAPLQPVTQGPVTFPSSPTPVAAPVVPSPTPITEVVRDKKEVTAPPAPVLPFLPFVPARPLKQDRN
jgi:filamentous hemagglutinin family protein